MPDNLDFKPLTPSQESTPIPAQSDSDPLDFKPLDPKGEEANLPAPIRDSYYREGVQAQLRSMPENQAVDQAVRINKGDIKWPLIHLKGMNPDVVAEVDRLAKSNGTDFDIAYLSKEQLTLSEQAHQIYNDLNSNDDKGNPKYPGVVKWFKDPLNMGKSHDDIAALKEIEALAAERAQMGEGKALQTLRGVTSSIEYAAGQIPSMVGATWNLGASIYAKAASLSQQKQGPSLGDLMQGDFSSPPVDFNSVEMTPAPEVLNTGFGLVPVMSAHAESYAPVLDDIQNRTFLGDVKESGPLSGRALQSFAIGSSSTIALLAAAWITRNPELALTLGAASSGGQQYTSDLFTGKSPEMASYDAAINFAAEYGFEKYFGTISMMDKIEHALSGSIKAESLGAITSRLGRLVLLTAAKGGLSEGATQAVQDTGDFVTGNPNAFGGEFAKIANATLLGFASDFSITGPTSILHGLAQARQQQQGQARWDKFSKTTEQSKLRQRDPEAFAKFVDTALTDQGRSTTVNIDADKLVTFFQGNNEELNKFAEDVGLPKENLENAVKAGDSVDINVGQYQAKYAGSTLDKALRNDIRFEPGGITQNEMAAEMARLTETAKELQQQVADIATNVNQLPQHINAMREQLVLPKDKGGMGFSADAADSQLSVLVAGVTTLARQRGETTVQAFERLGLSVSVGGKLVNTNGKMQIVKGEQVVGENAVPQGERGAITFGNGKTTIHLLSNADYSTFMHETGHLFLSEMQGLISQGLANDQTKADYESLIKYVGGQLDNTPEGRQRIEQVAKGFEQYLRDGRAPSVELVGAFAKFRTWLLSIYRSALALGTPISDDVRGVFNRILSSDEDIKEAENFYSRKGELIELLKADDIKKQQLREKKDKASVSALDKQVRGYLAAYLRSVGEDGKTGRQTIKEAAQSEVEKLPIYRAIEEARTNKISMESLKNAIGEDAAEALKKKYPMLITKEGTNTLAGLAAQFEFESPESLADVLGKALPRNDAAKVYADQMIHQRELELREHFLRRGATPADEAMHSDEALTYLIAETQMMAEQVNKTGRKVRFNERLYRGAARALLESMPVERAARYSLFAKAEARLSKQVVDAAKKGDWELAMQLRQKQVMQHILVQESIKVKDAYQKIVDRYRPKALESMLNGKNSGVENSYLDPIRQILVVYGLSDRMPSQMLDLSTYINDLDQTLYTMIPDWILRGDKEGDYRKMNWGDLKAVDEAVLSLVEVGKDTMKSLKGRDNKRASDFIADSTKNMAQLKSIFVPASKDVKALPVSAWRMLKSGTMMMPFLARQMDNFSRERTGEAGEMENLQYQMTQAELAKRQMDRELAVAADPHLKVLFKAGKRIEKENGVQFEVASLPLPEALYARGERNWTSEKLISFMLNLGSISNKQSLLNGYKYDERQIAIVSSYFLPKEMDAIQGLWDVTNTLFDPLDKTHFDVYNRHIEKVEAEPITLISKTGERVTLKGGYYPLQFDHDINMKVSERAEDARNEDLLNRTKNVLRSSKPKDGMTYSRTPGHSLPPRLSLNVWQTHIDDTTRYINLSSVVRDWNVVTRNEQWMKTFIDKFGVDDYDAMRRWLSYQAVPRKNPSNSWDSKIDRFADWMRSRATFALLGGKVFNSFQQRTALVNAAGSIGWKWIYQGYKSMGTDGLAKTATLGLANSEIVDWVMSKSAYLAQRETGILNREINDAVSDIKPGKWTTEIAGHVFNVQDLRNFAFVLLSMNDRSIIVPIWSGAYQKYMVEIRDPSLTDEEADKEAIKFADGVVQKNQPSALKSELSTFQLTEGWVRFFTAFMSWAFKFGNILHYQNRALSEGAITYKQWINHVAHNVMMEPMLRMTLYAIAGGSAPEWWEYLLAPIESYFSWIPGFSGQMYSLKKKGQLADIDSLVPAEEGYKRLKRLMSHAMSKSHDGYEVLWDAARLGEFVVGVPALNLVKEAKNTWATLTGDEELKKKYK